MPTYGFGTLIGGTLMGGTFTEGTVIGGAFGVEGLGLATFMRISPPCETATTLAVHTPPSQNPRTGELHRSARRREPTRYLWRFFSNHVAILINNTVMKST